MVELQSLISDAARLAADRGAGTRAALLDAAERLFGQKGMEGVSLREISQAAGQRNTSAVTYHFQRKQALVDAVMADRIGRVEAMRRESAGTLDAACEVADLLRLLWQPLLDLDKGRGGHWFIRFQLAHRVHYASARHPIAADPAAYPASIRILAAIGARLPHLAPDRLEYRLTLIAMMFWAAVTAHDQAVLAARQRWSSRFALEETIAIAVAALEASG